MLGEPFAGMSPLWAVVFFAIGVFGVGGAVYRYVVFPFGNWLRSGKAAGRADAGVPSPVTPEEIASLRAEVGELRARLIAAELNVSILQTLTKLDRDVSAAERNSIRRQIGRLLEVFTAAQAEGAKTYEQLSAVNEQLRQTLKNMPEAEVIGDEEKPS